MNRGASKLGKKKKKSMDEELKFNAVCVLLYRLHCR
jgi:hypothetical protein